MVTPAAPNMSGVVADATVGMSDIWSMRAACAATVPAATENAFAASPNFAAKKLRRFVNDTRFSRPETLSHIPISSAPTGFVFAVAP